MSSVHIVGGGIAALSAAVELAPQAEIFLYEAAAICGGRARSFYDSQLESYIDNGNHLILSGNQYLLRYLDLIGSRDRLKDQGKGFFPFFDLERQKAWNLSLSSGKIPFWLFSASCRPPNMKLKELTAFLKFLKAGPETTVSECLESGGLTDLLLKPLAISALNTSVQSGSAALFANIIKESLMKGGKGCHPLYPVKNLADAFIDPALSYLKSFKAHLNFNARVKEIISEKGRVTGLRIGKKLIPISDEDSVILATPSHVTRELLPEIQGPDRYESILNLHFSLPFLPLLKGPIAQSGFLGLNGGIAEWIFVKDRILSVTISAANRYSDRSKDSLIKQVWKELCFALKTVIEQDLFEIEMPTCRLINEKRATFEATPLENAKRPGTSTPLLNLVLAGDWIATSLPSTLEGAVRSGLAAVGELGFRSAISEGYHPA
ncbi:hypothetical protein FAI41_09035 [Acetobacteraceae bacterium]|nr:hypothetical protein FAI41_09035 [Acetobacteraceae bacterium]